MNEVPPRLVPKYGYLCAALSLVATVWLTPASGIDDPVLHGNDTICNEGVWVNFTCDGASLWLRNHLQLNHESDDNDYFIKSDYPHSFLSILCLFKFNSSIIFCYNSRTGRQSNSVSFLVQGLLGPVSDLVYLPHNQTLSWEPPFQLNTSQAITYNILVTKVTVDQPVVDLNQSETYLDLTGQLERGSTYNVSLWPLNAVGRGQETSMMFTEEPAATSSSVVTGSDGATSAPTDNPGQGGPGRRTSSNGAIAGGAVAVVLVAIVVGLAVVILVVICKRRGVRHAWRRLLTRTAQKDVEKDNAVKKRKIN